MTTQTYNGWTNYETWNVNLWLSNEEPSYRYWTDRAQEIWEEAEDDPPFTRSEQARIQLAYALKEEIEEGRPDETVTGLYGDLLGAALSEVNWHEIANAWLEECEGYEYDKD